MKTPTPNNSMHSLLAEIALLNDEDALVEWNVSNKVQCAALAPREQIAIKLALVRRRTRFASLRQSEKRAARYTGKRYAVPARKR